MSNESNNALDQGIRTINDSTEELDEIESVTLWVHSDGT